MGNASLWRAIVITSLACVLLAEVSSALALKLVGRPVYWTSDERTPPPSKTPLRSEKDLWGAWGKPNTTSRLTSQCFDVAYAYNSMGARDVERQKAASRRWIVLGDSFVEGYGIEQAERFTNILEEKTGWEFANFGASGDHGPLQYLLVYQLLAKQLEHQGVIVGLLPFNDFTDNDSEWWRRNRSPAEQARYRPYFVLSPDRRSYRAIYGANGDAAPREEFDEVPSVPQASAPVEEGQATSLSVRDVARFLSERSATFSLLRQISSELTQRHQPHSSGYFTVDQDEITTAKLALDDLAEEIGERPKIILLFPADSDLAERERRGVKFSDEMNAFVSALRSDGWRVIDMTDAVVDAYHSGDITLGCDGHWNPATNRMAAEFLLSHYGNVLSGTATKP